MMNKRLAKACSLGAFLCLVLSVAGSEAIVKQPAQSVAQQQQATQTQSQQQSRSDESSQQQPASSHQGGYNNNHQQQVGAQSVSQYTPSSGASVQQSGSLKNSNYYDGLSSGAGSQEQSYQAAANSVNMAFANAGLFSGYGSGSSNGGQSISAPASASSNSASGGASSQQLNPLHYFYYPPKESASGGQASKPADSMAAAASSSSGSQGVNYPAYQPSYADQLGVSAFAGPEAAASSQDPSYLPQPGANSGHMFSGSENGNMNGNGNSAPNQQQSQVAGPNQQMGGGLQQQQPQSQGYPQDLGAYASSGNPTAQQPKDHSGSQQSGGSVSFQGPSNDMNSYINSHLGSSGHQPSSFGSQGAGPSSSLYNQVGDLYTSNYGGPSVSSVASYLAPGQQHPGAQAHDPLGQAGSNLFSAASSLIGQQAPAGSGLFGSQNYPSSAYLSSQQFAGPGGDQHPMVAAASHPSHSMVNAASSGNKRFGLSSFIMPMLALAGLSLLIPTMSNIGTAVGRKKRSVDDRASSIDRQQQILYDSMNGMSQLAKESSIGEYLDKIERYYAIYKNAAENDDCMNRLICELGDAVKDITGKGAVITVIEKLAPTWMTGKVHMFREAAMDRKEGKEKCKKYVCHNGKRHQ